ncbi:hypothetical protein VOLCADRAFT_87065 [Volvox carteri f. nagariensis]|uniref:Uncharacterized protein n=1 Tax=Volvox carteri f. nagariensis TaxID=3068 RepID=D8TK29_VOLCA|nr:uncharacterized protein VOLCADRAFT_87065 [Volvox carteri f. nagariensis]EFJ52176.1 hypothetical protein VOLCADRAFT_87065 [Volvox carteri f. nagariensis]|eukprot:XP_002946950.1 hypothetical protein VOLCADRAFT_87065 [Volvox carteri f. nagariensis]
MSSESDEERDLLKAALGYNYVDSVISSRSSSDPEKDWVRGLAERATDPEIKERKKKGPFVYVKQAGKPGRHFYVNEEINQMKAERDYMKIKELLRRHNFKILGHVNIGTDPTSQPLVYNFGGDLLEEGRRFPRSVLASQADAASFVSFQDDDNYTSSEPAPVVPAAPTLVPERPASRRGARGEHGGREAPLYGTAAGSVLPRSVAATAAPAVTGGTEAAAIAAVSERGHSRHRGGSRRRDPHRHSERQEASPEAVAHRRAKSSSRRRGASRHHRSASAERGHEHKYDSRSRSRRRHRHDRHPHRERALVQFTTKIKTTADATSTTAAATATGIMNGTTARSTAAGSTTAAAAGGGTTTTITTMTSKGSGNGTIANSNGSKNGSGAVAEEAAQSPPPPPSSLGGKERLRTKTGNLKAKKVAPAPPVQSLPVTTAQPVGLPAAATGQHGDATAGGNFAGFPTPAAGT